MKANVLDINAFIPDCLKHFFSKMKARRRRRDRASYAGVKGLVTLDIELLGLAVEIGRNRHLPAEFEHAAEWLTTLPREFYCAGLTISGKQPGLELHAGQVVMASVLGEGIRKKIVFPAL